MTNKKGTIWTVLNLLVAVIIMIVLVTIFSPNLMGSKINTVVDRNVCELSIYLKYSATKATFGLKESGELKCPVEEVEIKNTDEKKTMKILADQMKSCWDKMGEGKIDFLGDIDVGITSTSRCVVCSKIIAKDQDSEKVINIKDFTDFLNKNSYKIGTKTTYTSYFYGAENAQVDVGNEGNIVIDDEVPNYVVFIANKRGDLQNTLNAMGYGVAGIIAISPVVRPVATASSLLQGGAFIFKNLLTPKVLLKGVAKTSGALTIVGLAIDLSYKPDLYTTLVLAPGEEIVNKCDRLE